MSANSGVAGFVGAVGEQSQWLPLTESTNFKKNHNYLISFYLSQ
jgi:hypothetical protein